MQFYQMLSGSFHLTQMKIILFPHVNIYNKKISEIILQHEMIVLSRKLRSEVDYCVIQELLKCLIFKIRQNKFRLFFPCKCQ